MQLHPTRATFQVAVAGAIVVATGIAAKVGPAVAFGGAMLLAVAVGRALAIATVTRLRASGFEMVWTNADRVSRAARGETIVLEAELRNRGVDDARGVSLRAVASSMLAVDVQPESVNLPAKAKVRVTVRVTPRRVGRWGVHGIALEVRGTPLGGEGLYEVPLMFANPHGVESVPRPLTSMIERARGGRSRHAAEAGRPARLRGEGEQLRELRAFVPGDPFRRIAWKASARRGALLVREMEREERDVVWLVLDASVELWAGEPGHAPLDLAIEELAATAAKHLSRGTRVGVAIVASRLRAWVPPDARPSQAERIRGALLDTAILVDVDRCELEEPEIALRVVEHLRPLDPRGLSDVPRGNLDALAGRAEAMRPRAPFAPRLPEATSPREARLRHYLASFGVEVPPRVDGERTRAEAQLAAVFDELGRHKKDRPSIVHVWAQIEEHDDGRFSRALRRLQRNHVEVRWTLPKHAPGLSRRATEHISTVHEAVHEAVRRRTEAAQVRSARALRRLGVHARPLPRRGADE